MTEKKLINILRSGDFTIIYWDREQPTIYKGKWDFNKEFEKDDYAEMNKHEIEFDFYNLNGYVPDIVTLLVKALKGKVDSI